MIRINLLSVRAARKKEQFHAQGIIVVLAIAATIVACVAIYLALEAKIQSAQAEVENKESEIRRLKTTIGEVGRFDQKKKELSAKLDILDKLKENRSGPVRVLDALSKATPEKVWIESFVQAGEVVTIKGLGMNQEAVADFMRNLEESEYYQNVELEVIAQRTTAGRSLESFTVRCGLEAVQKKAVKQ